MQFNLVDDSKIDALRKRALDGLANLLKIEAVIQEKAKRELNVREGIEQGEADKKKKVRNRIKDGKFFITSAVQDPPWDKQPSEWAPDWCAGWAIPVAALFAQALGIELTKRTQTRYELDEKGNKIPEKTSDGKIKYKSYRHNFFIWTQSTAFAFKTGYVIHTYPPEYAYASWEEQLKHNPVFLQITEARPATPVDEAIQRDPGFVRFKIYIQNKNHIIGEKTEKELETTQDGFVRYLITGELPVLSNG